jgi:hypothetical protein
MFTFERFLMQVTFDETTTIKASAMMDVVAERESQPPFDDSENTEGLWAGYICNYATRWAMPFTFNSTKYKFRTCMVKVAALAFAAIEWIDSCEDGSHCDFDSKQAEKVTASVK